MAAAALVLYYFLVYCNVCQCPFFRFPGRCPVTASQSYGFFLFRQTFPQKNCWKSCEAGVGPGPPPGFLLKSECKVTNLRRNFQMFLQLFFEENQPQVRNTLQTHRLQPQKKLTKQKFHDRHNRPIPPRAQAGPSTDLNLLNIYAHAKNLLVKKKYRTFAYHKRRKTCY